MFNVELSAKILKKVYPEEPENEKLYLIFSLCTYITDGIWQVGQTNPLDRNFGIYLQW